MSLFLCGKNAGARRVRRISYATCNYNYYNNGTFTHIDVVKDIDEMTSP